MDLYLIRHGETEDNLKKIYSRDTIGLTEKGKEQIVQLNPIVSKIDYEVVLVSPLIRAKESLNLLEIKERITIKEDSRLEEISFGDFKGHTYEDNLFLYPFETKKWTKDPFQNSPPNGESIYEAYQRVSSLYAELKKENRNTLLVAHEGIIRLIVCCFLNCPDYFFKFSFHNGSLSHLVLEKSFSFISQLNYKIVTK